MDSHYIDLEHPQDLTIGTLEPGDTDRFGKTMPGYDEEEARRILAKPLAQYPALNLMPLHMLLSVYTAGFGEARRIVNETSKEQEAPF